MPEVLCFFLLACLQARNYVGRKEQERKRRELFDDALAKFNKGDVEVGLQYPAVPDHCHVHVIHNDYVILHST